ncbi:uncharacterized protein LOC111653789 [Seriola lalandi dorsalis]|uniref:uncharacterized protein LOC111653789 n=1 Tax=Seriola lalandi dorsalis TaxID=1841481 RepID=UPI000C6F7694|nr:uncharacterized protein LOC111653789 [Seriola lalandi dorsalis]
MESALMAWVWIGFTLAQLNNAESRWYAHGRLAGQDELYTGIEQPLDAAPADRSFPSLVWYFLKGSGKGPEKSDFNQPQYRCSNRTLFLRFSLIRYTNLQLEDGVHLLSLPDSCHSSIQIYRWWLLVKLPYTGCQTAVQTGDGNGFHPLKLHYFDRLLKENMTGMAVCDNPSTSPPAVSPLVTCGAAHVTVTLPRETQLKKVKALDFFSSEGYSVRQRKTSSTLFVAISMLPERESVFELVYVDGTGRPCAMLAACYLTLPKKVGRHHVKRAADDPDLFNLWDFNEVPSEPFEPETPVTTQTTASSTAASAVTEEENFGDFDEFWGFEKIPDGPYTGTDAETPGSTAAPATTSTTAPATSTTPSRLLLHHTERLLHHTERLLLHHTERLLHHHTERLLHYKRGVEDYWCCLHHAGRRLLHHTERLLHYERGVNDNYWRLLHYERRVDDYWRLHHHEHRVDDYWRLHLHDGRLLHYERRVNDYWRLHHYERRVDDYWRLHHHDGRLLHYERRVDDYWRLHHDGRLHHHDGRLHHHDGRLLHYDGCLHHHDGRFLHYERGVNVDYWRFHHHDRRLHHHDGRLNDDYWRLHHHDGRLNDDYGRLNDDYWRLHHHDGRLNDDYWRLHHHDGRLNDDD